MYFLNGVPLFWKRIPSALELSILPLLSLCFFFLASGLGYNFHDDTTAFMISHR